MTITTPIPNAPTAGDNSRSQQRACSASPCRFTVDDANREGDLWRFNCGPAALCAIFNLTPSELRPHMGDFESKGYTNPTLMWQVLDTLGAKWQLVYRGDNPAQTPKIKFGLMRVQWAGPWTRPGVPMRVRYRQTHWVAARNYSSEIFDINAMCSGGWLPYDEWAFQLIPWLIGEVVPKGDGGWWPTHALEVTPNDKLSA